MKLLKGFMIKRQDILGAFLVSFPILLYWAYWTLNPSYAFNNDPAAIYFLDSLSIFIGKSYVYVDHPGTPVQIIGSLLLAITYPFFGNSEAFARFFISRPNVFYFMTHLFLLVANIFCAVVFYKTVSSSLTKNKTVGAFAISLLFFAIHPQSYRYLTFWSHNSLNYAFGALLFVWLYRELCSPRSVNSNKLILLGFAFGVYSMAQIYFLAWPATLTLIIFLFSKRSGAGIAQAIKTASYPALGAALGIISMLIPIYKELPRLFGWLVDVTTHTGAYGSGESGIITFTMIQSAVGFWWDFIRPMMLLLILCVIVLAIIGYQNRKNNSRFSPADFAMTTGILFHILLILFVMVKASVQLRYSLPLAATLPLLVFILTRQLETTSSISKIPLLAFHLLILIGVFIPLAGQKAVIDDRANVEQIAQRDKSQAVKKLANAMGVKEEDVFVVYARAVPLKCAGLLHATNWTGNFREEIEEICPNQILILDTPIELNTAVPKTDIRDIDWDLVIWPGNGSNLPEYLKSIGAVNVPRNWYVEYRAWYFIHSEVLSE